MSGVAKINIVESAAELKSLLNEQKTGTGKERVQALYLLKTNQVSSVKHLALVLGRSRITVQRWLRLYRDGGVEAMLKVPQRTGRPRLIPEWAIARLQSELADPEGFNSYQEVVVWLDAVLDIKVSYDVVYYLVHNVLQAKLKVPRPKSEKLDPLVQEKFKTKLASIIESLISTGVSGLKIIERIRYWCQDETRLGLKTIGGKKLTANGVKPIGLVQWDFLTYWLYGLVEPQTGNSFFWEFSHLDAACCERFFG
ncbi:MAG TPA: IS630 family transposase [Oscillatoriaceae cyanobacterium M33_DOE_052]|nr:IS630 family transposase [Oscillatoriaceae cyanobacterium M33_DOE_052]